MPRPKKHNRRKVANEESFLRLHAAAKSAISFISAAD